MRPSVKTTTLGSATPSNLQSDSLMSRTGAPGSPWQSSTRLACAALEPLDDDVSEDRLERAVRPLLVIEVAGNHGAADLADVDIAEVKILEQSAANRIV